MVGSYGCCTYLLSLGSIEWHIVILFGMLYDIHSIALLYIQYRYYGTVHSVRCIKQDKQYLCMLYIQYVNEISFGGRKVHLGILVNYLFQSYYEA